LIVSCRNTTGCTLYIHVSFETSRSLSIKATSHNYISCRRIYLEILSFVYRRHRCLQARLHRITMATDQSHSLSIVGDAVGSRRIRPTVVTDLHTATTLASSVNTQGMSSGTADHPSSTSSRSSASSARLCRSLAFTEDADRLVQFRGRSFEKTPARTHNGPRAAQSTVVLLCSGKNCLDTTTSPTTSNGSGALNDAEVSGSGFTRVVDGTADLQVSIRRTSDQLISQQKASGRDLTQQMSDFGRVSRSSRSSWFDNDDSLDRPKQQRRISNDSAVAAAATARQHIYACQLPGSVKRSSRVTSDLSNLMATLREKQNHSLSSAVDRKSGPPDSEPCEAVIEAVVTQRHKLPSSGTSASLTRGFSGGRRPVASGGGRRSRPMMARGGFGFGQRQASSLSTADVEPLLCITSLELPTTVYRASGNARFAANGDRTDRRVASELSVFRQTLTPATS